MQSSYRDHSVLLFLWLFFSVDASLIRCSINSEMMQRVKELHHLRCELNRIAWSRVRDETDAVVLEVKERQIGVEVSEEVSYQTTSTSFTVLIMRTTSRLRREKGTLQGMIKTSTDCLYLVQVKYLYLDRF